jgi:hypothetical protein
MLCKDDKQNVTLESNLPCFGLGQYLFDTKFYYNLNMNPLILHVKFPLRFTFFF